MLKAMKSQLNEGPALDYISRMSKSGLEQGAPSPNPNSLTLPPILPLARSENLTSSVLPDHLSGSDQLNEAISETGVWCRKLIFNNL